MSCILGEGPLDQGTLVSSGAGRSGSLGWWLLSSVVIVLLTHAVIGWHQWLSMSPNQKKLRAVVRSIGELRTTLCPSVCAEQTAKASKTSGAT